MPTAIQHADEQLFVAAYRWCGVPYGSLAYHPRFDALVERATGISNPTDHDRRRAWLIITKLKRAGRLPTICRTAKLPDNYGYLCRQCAETMGGKWPDDHVATFHTAKCDSCDESNWVANVGDWNWPDDKARGMRD